MIFILSKILASTYTIVQLFLNGSKNFIECSLKRPWRVNQELSFVSKYLIPSLRNFFKPLKVANSQKTLKQLKLRIGFVIFFSLLYFWYKLVTETSILLWYTWHVTLLVRVWRLSCPINRRNSLPCTVRTSKQRSCNLRVGCNLT